MSEPDPPAYDVWFTEDPSTFLAVAEDHLALDPVLSTVVSSVTHRVVRQLERGGAAPDHPRWWAVVCDPAGEVVGVAMRTAPFAPYPLFVLPMPDAAARALARALHDRGEEALGFNGALPAAQTCADEAAGLAGLTAGIWEHTRLHVLAEVIRPRPCAGTMRLATEADADVCLRWFQAFADDADEQAGRDRGGAAGEGHTREDIDERIAEERIVLWEVEREVVHLTGFNPPSFGVCRVGPVYTPREHRGRGYASAAVAELSGRLQAGGATVCLFTDQANPTSNRIYEAIGFRPVADLANLLVGPLTPPA